MLSNKSSTPVPKTWVAVSNSHLWRTPVGLGFNSFRPSGSITLPTKGQAVTAV